MRLGNSRARGRLRARRLALFLATLAGICGYTHAQETVDLGVTLYDDLGFEWDIHQYGYVGDGSDDAYEPATACPSTACRSLRSQRRPPNWTATSS